MNTPPPIPIPRIVRKKKPIPTLTLAIIIAVPALMFISLLSAFVADHIPKTDPVTIAALPFEKYPETQWAAQIKAIAADTTKKSRYDVDDSKWVKDRSERLVWIVSYLEKQNEPTDYIQKTLDAMEHHTLFIGIVGRAVFVSLGTSDKINETETADGTTAQYVYENEYVYIGTDRCVSAIQKN